MRDLQIVSENVLVSVVSVHVCDSVVLANRPFVFVQKEVSFGLHYILSAVISFIAVLWFRAVSPVTNPRCSTCITFRSFSDALISNQADH